jgi:hypothetical protein
MDEDEIIEQALDEADEAAAATQERLTAEELFTRIWRSRIEQQK